jgi:hypothetical protein
MIEPGTVAHTVAIAHDIVEVIRKHDRRNLTKGDLLALLLDAATTIVGADRDGNPSVAAYLRWIRAPYDDTPLARIDDILGDAIDLALALPSVEDDPQ